MQIVLDTGTGNQIQAYEPGCVTINETKFTRSIIIGPKVLITDWHPQNMADLQAIHFEIILKLSPKIFLLGTGNTQAFPPSSIHSVILEHGIGIEIMNTAAACRTYMALAAEQRDVVAALLLEN